MQRLSQILRVRSTETRFSTDEVHLIWLRLIRLTTTTPSKSSRAHWLIVESNEFGAMSSVMRVTFVATRLEKGGSGTTFSGTSELRPPHFLLMETQLMSA